MLLANITDVQVFQIHRVILHINHVAVSCSRIRATPFIGALNIADVRQRGVKACEFIEENLVALTDLLLQVNLVQHSSIHIILGVPTRPTGPPERTIIYLCSWLAIFRGTIIGIHQE